MTVLHMFLGYGGHFDSIRFPTFATEDTRVDCQAALGPAGRHHVSYNGRKWKGRKILVFVVRGCQ